MKAKIFSFVKVSDNSIVASVRIARFISQTLDIPIATDDSIASESLDALLVVGGAYAFSKSLESLGAAILESRIVIWVQNDWTVIPPKDEGSAESPFRKAFRDRFVATNEPSVSFWTTVEDMSCPGVSRSGHRCGAKSRYLNWNILACEPQTPLPFADRSAADSLLYYGSMRKDREKYFARYFGSPVTHTVFSCPSREIPYPNVVHETKIMELLPYLSHFGLGLYLEDRKSHTEFHSPANRLYEMMSAGLPIVFQPECQRMMAKAGYDISEFIAWNAESIPSLMERREEILDIQATDWLPKAVRDREQLTADLVAAWSEVSS